MERFIADLVQGLDNGQIDRREFCKTVALAAAVYGGGDAAQAPRLVRIGSQHEERGHAG